MTENIPEKLEKVKLLVSMGGDRFSHAPGEVIEVTADEAQRLFAANMAVAAPSGSAVTATRGPTFAEVPEGSSPPHTGPALTGNGPPSHDSASDSARAPSSRASEPAAEAPSDKGPARKGPARKGPARKEK